MPLQRVQRYRAGFQHGVVVLAQVELGPQLVPGLGPQLGNLHLPDLVGQRLARGADVAIDLVDNVLVSLGGVGLEIGDRLFAAPAHRMHAGVDHQPHRAPHLIGQLAEAVVGVVIQAHVVTELLGIKAPALTIGDEIRGAPEHRRVRQLQTARELEVMARHRLMQRQRHHFPGRTHFGLVQVDVIVTRPAAVAGTLLVVGGGGVGRDVVRDRAHAVGLARDDLEDLDQFRIDAFCQRAVMGQQRVRCLLEKARIATQVGEELGHRTLETGLRFDRFHLAADARDLFQADGMDLCRGQVSGRVVAGEEVVIRLAVG